MTEAVKWVHRWKSDAVNGWSDYHAPSWGTLIVLQTTAQEALLSGHGIQQNGMQAGLVLGFNQITLQKSYRPVKRILHSSLAIFVTNRQLADCSWKHQNYSSRMWELARVKNNLSGSTINVILMLYHWLCCNFMWTIVKITFSNSVMHPLNGLSFS